MKQIRFVEQCLKYHLCNECKEVIMKGEGYFNFTVTSPSTYGKGQHYESAKKVCFQCYHVAQRTFRKEDKVKRLSADIKRLNADIKRVRNSVDQLVDSMENMKSNITNVNNTIAEINNKITELEE